MVRSGPARRPPTARRTEGCQVESGSGGRRRFHLRHMAVPAQCCGCSDWWQGSHRKDPPSRKSRPGRLQPWGSRRGRGRSTHATECHRGRGRRFGRREPTPRLSPADRQRPEQRRQQPSWAPVLTTIRCEFHRGEVELWQHTPGLTARSGGDPGTGRSQLRPSREPRRRHEECRQRKQR